MAELQDSSFCMLIICMLWLFCALYSTGMFVLQSNVLAVADNLVYGPCFCLVWKWTSLSADTPLVSIYLGQEALEFEAAEFRMAFTAGLPRSLLPLPALAFKTHTFELKSSTLLIWELKYECQSLVDCASFNDFSTDSLSDFEWVRRSRSQQSWITPSSKQLSPSPIILLSSDHILEAIVTSVFSPIIITQSCRNDLQLLQSAWKLSELTHFGRPPSLEIKSWVFFQWEQDFSMCQEKKRWRAPCGLLRMSFWRVVWPEEESRKRPLLPGGLLCPRSDYPTDFSISWCFTRTEDGNKAYVASSLLHVCVPLYNFGDAGLVAGVGEGEGRNGEGQ